MNSSTAGNDAVLGTTTYLARMSQDKDATYLGVDEGSTFDSVANHGDAEPVTSKRELWAWYFYSFGNNSAGTLSYAPLIFQSVLDQAGFNGNDPSEDCSVDPLAPCLVKFGTSNVNISSVVLISGGLVFAFQGVILLLFGSMGDYGTIKKWILIFWTVVCWGAQFGFLGIKHPSQYNAAIGVYIISTLSYNLCVAFYTPSFPGLARNLPETLEQKRQLDAGEISEEEYTRSHMIMRNKLNNYSFGALSVGYTITLLIALGAAYGLGANDSDSANLRAAVIIVGISTGVWILSAVPWFFLEKKRGNALPAGETYISVGVKTYWQALRHANRLSQVWLYLAGYFILSDGWTTTQGIYGICQNSIVEFSTTTSTEVYVVQGICNVVGILAYWLVQKRWKIKTKTILIFNSFTLILMAIWGCIGIGTTKFGFHNTWEVWAFSAIACAIAAPTFTFSATMLSDLVPKGREVTFFALYALVGKSTAWIGPIISGVIINHTGNTWKGFPFALALTVVGFVMICFVNVEKAMKERDAWEKNDPTLPHQEE